MGSSRAIQLRMTRASSATVSEKVIQPTVVTPSRRRRGRKISRQVFLQSLKCYERNGMVRTADEEGGRCGTASSGRRMQGQKARARRPRPSPGVTREEAARADESSIRLCHHAEVVVLVLPPSHPLPNPSTPVAHPPLPPCVRVACGRVRPAIAMRMALSVSKAQVMSPSPR